MNTLIISAVVVVVLIQRSVRGPPQAAVTDFDVVVGYADGAPDGHRHPVRWTAGGQIVDLGLPPGAVDGTATGINNRGLIVGWADFSGGGPHAVLWDRDNRVIELPPVPGQAFSAALGITEDGLVVGDVGLDGYHAARWQYRGGEIRPPVVLEADSYLYGMSRSGIAIAPGVPGVRWDRSGHVTGLKPLHDSGASYPTAVNNAGIVVGSSGQPDGTATPVWWDRAGTPHEFPEPAPWSPAGVRAINEAGTIVGMAEFPDGLHAALWR
jgi:probable HAF family extracellular repeat protein